MKAGLLKKPTSIHELTPLLMAKKALDETSIASPMKTMKSNLSSTSSVSSS
jgi:hypothetical protein